MSPTLTPPSLRSATSTTASMGSSATICAISRPTIEKAAWPTSAVVSVTMPDHGAVHDAAVALGLGHGERRLRRLVLRFEIDEVELRHHAVLDQPPLRVELGLALGQQGLGLCDLGFACLVGEDGDHVALLHLVAAPDPELGEDAAGSGNHHHLAVGFGTAGQHELAAVRQAVRLGDCDPEQLLRRRFGWTDGGAAFAVLMRQQVPGGDPEAGAEHQPQGGEAACFHLCISDGWSPDALAVRRL